MNKVENHSFNPLPKYNKSGVGRRKQIFYKYMLSLSLMIDLTECELNSRSWIPIINYFDYSKIKCIHKLLFIGEKPEGQSGPQDHVRIVRPSLTSTPEQNCCGELTLRHCLHGITCISPLFPSSESYLSTATFTREPHILPYWEISTFRWFPLSEALLAQPLDPQMVAFLTEECLSLMS